MHSGEGMVEERQSGHEKRAETKSFVAAKLEQDVENQTVMSGRLNRYGRRAEMMEEACSWSKREAKRKVEE